MVAVKRVPEPILDHDVDQFGGAHLGAFAKMHAVWRLAHAFLAAGDDNGTVAELDGLGTQGHRAQPRSAKLVDAVSRLFERNPGPDSGLAGRILTGAGGQNLTQDDFSDIRRIDSGAAQRLYDRGFAQGMGRNRTQAATKSADRRARPGGDDNFRHYGFSSIKRGGVRAAWETHELLEPA